MSTIVLVRCSDGCGNSWTEGDDPTCDCHDPSEHFRERFVPEFTVGGAAMMLASETGLGSGEAESLLKRCAGLVGGDLQRAHKLARVCALAGTSRRGCTPDGMLTAVCESLARCS